MANYTLNKTGAQIDTILGKADKLPTLSSSDNDKQLTVDSSGNIVATTISKVASAVSYLTTAPSSDNTSGILTFVVLSSEPSTKYNGYIYIITGSN